MKVYDVLIAGAGPAGSALAIELAGEGHSVLLVDAARFPRDKPCGDFVSPKGLARLEALGCGPALRDCGSQPIRGSTLYLNRDLLVEGKIPEVSGLPDHGLAIPRKRLDELIFRRAISQGAEVREGSRVTAFRRSATGVVVTLLSGGKTEEIHARLIVGADGANSTVAELAGMRMNDPRFTLASVRAYVRGLSVDRTLMYFDEQYFPGYGWVFPIKPGLCNIGVGMVKETMVKHGLRLPEFYQRFLRFVRRLAEARGVQIEIEPHKGWPIRTYGGAFENHFPGGLLIGEAAAIVDPINGEGIPLALESAHVAAATLRRVLARGDLSENSLHEYEAGWRAKFDPDLSISDLAVSMIRNRHLLPLWITLFRTTSLTASTDRRYAEVTGGVLAGVVPARQAITPEMFVRSVFHGPQFWAQVFGLGRETSWTGRAARAADALRWQTQLARTAVEDGPWFRAWLQEVESKQRKLVTRAVGTAVQRLRTGPW